MLDITSIPEMDLFEVPESYRCCCIACQLQPINGRDTLDVDGQLYCTKHPKFVEMAQELVDLELAYEQYIEDQTNEHRKP